LRRLSGGSTLGRPIRPSCGPVGKREIIVSESTSTSLGDQPAGLQDEVGTPSHEDTGAILFPELVWAHHVWQHEAGFGPRRASDDGSPEPVPGLAGGRGRRRSEEVYRAKLRAFELAEGEILDAYWCWNEASAVALTAKRRRGLWLRRRERELHLHRVTDWATMRLHEVTELMHRFDSLAIRASEILTPAPKRIAMERIFAEQSYLLGFVETTDRKPSKEELSQLVEKQTKTLADIEGYYDRAAQNAARIYYFLGMMLGLGVLAFAAAAVTLPLILFGDVERVAMRDYLSSFLAGAVGAIVSVMSRMRQDPRSPQAFRVDYEVGKAPLWFLGAIRPVLGAIFGTATYFALQSGLIVLTPATEETEFYFYALLAFLSGFSERFTHILLGQVEDAVATPSGTQPRRSASEIDDGERTPRTTTTDGDRT
jgi:hypothetical protein